MKRYEREITWWFKELEKQSLVLEYLDLFPELKSRLSKFAIGILLWEMKGIISTDNTGDIELIRNMLKQIEFKDFMDKLDETFNDMTPQQVLSLLSDNEKE